MCEFETSGEVFGSRMEVGQVRFTDGITLEVVLVMCCVFTRVDVCPSMGDENEETDGRGREEDTKAKSHLRIRTAKIPP